MRLYKKTQMIPFLVLLSLFMAMCFTACKTQVSDIQETPEMKKLSRLAKSYNVNIISEWNGYVYTFLGWNDERLGSTLYRFSLDDTHYKKPVFVAEGVERFFPTDEYVFILKKNSLNIHRVTIEGTDEVMLFDGVCYAIVVEGDTVFFASSDGELFSMDQDGGSLQRLYSGTRIFNIFPDGEYLYFCDNSAILRFSYEDGSVQRIVESDELYTFFVIDEKIYYYGRYFYCVDTSGDNNIKIFTHRLIDYTIDFYRDNLIFTAIVNGTGIVTYAMDLKTQELTTISKTPHNYAYVIGNKLFTEQGIFDLDKQRMTNRPLP